jgi:hypothetical protein
MAVGCELSCRVEENRSFSIGIQNFGAIAQNFATISLALRLVYLVTIGELLVSWGLSCGCIF